MVDVSDLISYINYDGFSSLVVLIFLGGLLYNL